MAERFCRSICQKLFLLPRFNPFYPKSASINPFSRHQPASTLLRYDCWFSCRKGSFLPHLISPVLVFFFWLRFSSDILNSKTSFNGRWKVENCWDFWLLTDSICSVRTCSKKWVVFEKPLTHMFRTFTMQRTHAIIYLVSTFVIVIWSYSTIIRHAHSRNWKMRRKKRNWSKYASEWELTNKTKE